MTMDNGFHEMCIQLPMHLTAYAANKNKIIINLCRTQRSPCFFLQGKVHQKHDVV
ncbi:hypothetical protein Lalb_Chr25g0281391 [Lupinus albus]|uniref:Uncharacterized protein n=1 Tax=Lupinus albus TaxID=3870 RepID=A0A6A4N2C6_LUPAL|nr:hypothetical protein Lalb_Chr25g0281391 [Lupinus albus]